LSTNLRIGEKNTTKTNKQQTKQKTDGFEFAYVGQEREKLTLLDNVSLLLVNVVVNPHGLVVLQVQLL